MRSWTLLGLLLVAFVALGIAPVSDVAEESCAECPAADAGGEECADGCPFCVCGPHRTPMMSAPSAPHPPSLPAVEHTASADFAPPAPDPRDILHVPRLLPA
jgi:hypothetical protein